ncbi:MULTISPECIES: hypothetical protein [Arthrospira]|uniref:Uncharacterized protein n=1 Tax=Limnospira platensis NIES-46 TaxID=1236695 RepID=A0A5M3T2H2_LIMPL|nr:MULTISPECIES: hypothetical protein [Arthrospira]MBD2668141.1 hypothetical protein [Arthrospira platensis FACHB-439]MBD2708700.1 hypothetical protein [Arthrospira platensis FACHB-835]MDF2212354.1 hypothetical protein [Arthrospira platensis NCB002]MDT9181557.1 hypothetical protein [Limnospira sp. PMC 289.06]MDT9293817.1 hypothetical protein [Arthrospira platensis PCC 7345]MDT9309280.1 hypothetical protein [Limnospira sp. Paracas R14]QQW27600.1 hypothetical protein AP9108_20620 [Arthrospira 
MTTESDHIYLNHILECSDRIREYTGEDRSILMQNTLLKDAVWRRLQT